MDVDELWDDNLERLARGDVKAVRDDLRNRWIRADDAIEFANYVMKIVRITSAVDAEEDDDET